MEITLFQESAIAFQLAFNYLSFHCISAQSW